MKYSNKLLLAVTACLSMASSAFAEDEKVNYNESTLTGDWGGARTELADKGIETDITYKADVMGNVSGGIKEGTRFLDNLDVIFNFDGNKLFGSEGTSALIHVINNDGGRPDNDLVGSAQGVDNIEVPRATAKLYQAWIQQQMFDDKFSVLAGLYDINSEFYVTESSLLFIHSTYGIGTDVAQSGFNGPSIFPFTSAGIRAKYQPNDELYLQVAVLDGFPGDPQNVKGTHVQFNSSDGAFTIAEAGYIIGGGDPIGKIGVGVWNYSEEFPNPVTGNNESSNGFYLIGEHKLYTEKDDKKQGLTGFAHIGTASEQVNQFDYAWSLGAVYTGAFEGRDEDQLGFGMAGAHTGQTFRDAANIAGTPVEGNETQFELTYSANITPWFTVQPDIQYIINPGTDPALDNALVTGVRVTTGF